MVVLEIEGVALVGDRIGHAVAVIVVAEIIVAGVAEAERVAELVVERLQAVETRIELQRCWC